MATDKKSNTATLKSIAWLAFSAQQAYVGYLVLAHFHNYVSIAGGLVSLGIAVAVIVAHFFRAHK